MNEDDIMKKYQDITQLLEIVRGCGIDRGEYICWYIMVGKKFPETDSDNEKSKWYRKNTIELTIDDYIIKNKENKEIIYKTLGFIKFLLTKKQTLFNLCELKLGNYKKKHELHLLSSGFYNPNFNKYGLYDNFNDWWGR